MRKLAVIIPALDESLTIGEVVRGARVHGCDVYVVDDASNDDTGDLALSAGAEVLTLPFRSGAWCAVQAGLLHAMKKGQYEAFLTMDGDGQHDPACISQLTEALDSPDEVVVGSFPERGSIARRTAWRFFSILTRLPIQDLTSGLRLYGGRAAEALLSRRASMYDYQDIGVLLQLRRQGVTFNEVPVTMRARQSGCSRVFRSWAAVAVYMIRTCMLILADLGAKSRNISADWRKYDSI